MSAVGYNIMKHLIISMLLLFSSFFKIFEQDKVIVDGLSFNWIVNWGGLFDISEVSHIYIFTIK